MTRGGIRTVLRISIVVGSLLFHGYHLIGGKGGMYDYYYLQKNSGVLQKKIGTINDKLALLEDKKKRWLSSELATEKKLYRDLLVSKGERFYVLG